MALVAAIVTLGGLGLVGSLVTKVNKIESEEESSQQLTFDDIENVKTADNTAFMLHPNPQSVIDGSSQYTPFVTPGAAPGLGNPGVRQDYLNLVSGSSSADNVAYMNKTEPISLFDPSPQQTTGNTYTNTSNRFVNSTMMNNVGPINQEQVGPGLALGPDNPGQGGFQQFFRVLPDNVGAYKLNELDGRIVSGMAIPKPQMESDVHVNDLPKYFTQGERPMLPGRSVVTAETIRPWTTDTITNRSETMAECSMLSVGDAGFYVSAPPTGQHQTRTRCDNHDSSQMNAGFTHGAPREGYTDTSYKAKPTDRGLKYKSTGNAGRMNIQLDPHMGLGQNDLPMDDCNPDRMGSFGTQGSVQDYIGLGKIQDNPFLGEINPRACPESLAIAIEQLKTNIAANPYAKN
ncbi:MAG: hypothetical protein CMM25_04735 [Rhodospirillaceae bacterium]|nr:hypothetical protein [Rhodospirillaceae bacterium]